MTAGLLIDGQEVLDGDEEEDEAGTPCGIAVVESAATVGLI
jgi:hypothetical protein